MSWRAPLSSVWIKGLLLSTAVVLLLATLTSGYSRGLCSTRKACQADCCPCPQDMCVADTTPHQVVVQPGLIPSFRSAPLSLLGAMPWQVPAGAIGSPGRHAAAANLLADPGRFPHGPSRPQLNVWLI